MCRFYEPIAMILQICDKRPQFCNNLHLVRQASAGDVIPRESQHTTDQRLRTKFVLPDLAEAHSTDLLRRDKII
jgi:hypothetical protein